MFQTKLFTENRNRTFYVQWLFFPSKNRAVYEIMWENMVEPDRPQVTIWRMRTACCIPKATNAHTESDNNGYGNAPQCYVIRTMPVLIFTKHSCFLRPQRLYHCVSSAVPQTLYSLASLNDGDTL